MGEVAWWKAAWHTRLEGRWEKGDMADKAYMIVLESDESRPEGIERI